MKTAFVIAISIFLTSSGFAQENSVKELAPGVFYVFGDELKHSSANCVWIVLNDYVLVIDANYPWAAKQLLLEIGKTTSKPVRFIFNTHYHHDHSFGNGIFADQGATVVATDATADEMKIIGKKEWEQNYSGQPLDGYKQVFPTLTFNERLVFQDENHRVELIKMGPAHTSGDAVAFLPKENILITGDLFVNGNPWGNNVADPNVDYDRWLNVLDTLIKWNPALIIPGHGSPATVHELENQRAYLSAMVEQVKKAIQSGLSRQQTIQSVDLANFPVYGKNKISTDRSVGAMYDKLIFDSGTKVRTDK